MESDRYDRYDRYNRRRRAQMMARRRRIVRRQRMLVGACFLVLAAVVGTISVNAYRGAKSAQRREKALECLASVYEADMGLEKGSGEAFAEWVEREYTDALEGALADAAISDDKLTAEEVYEALGSSLYVLKDQYEGKLKDADTTAQNGIYQREGAQDGTVTISIAGDLCLEEDGFVLDHYDEVNDLEKCISPEILKITQNADLFYLNHEYTVSERGTPLENKLYTFRAKPERMELLKEMGVDLVSLANNHVYDYGPDALLDTADYLEESRIPYVGGGRNIEEAKKPLYFVVDGLKIGFVAASSAEKYRMTPAATEDSPGILEAYDTTLYKEVIAGAAGECDYLIAYIHWGPEDEKEFDDWQPAEAEEFLDAGADIVVGGHPHVLQGMQYIDGKPVIYSMGDFWFNDETKYTGLLNLEITADGLKKMQFTPCLQTEYTTQYIEDTEGQRELFDYIEQLSPNIEIDEDGTITEASG